MKVRMKVGKKKEYIYILILVLINRQNSKQANDKNNQRLVQYNIV